MLSVNLQHRLQHLCSEQLQHLRYGHRRLHDGLWHWLQRRASDDHIGCNVSANERSGAPERSTEASDYELTSSICEAQAIQGFALISSANPFCFDSVFPKAIP